MRSTAAQACTLATIAVALAASACDDDAETTRRADAGVAASDGGGARVDAGSGAARDAGTVAALDAGVAPGVDSGVMMMGAGEPPFGGTSGGSGGAVPVAGSVMSTGSGVEFRLIVPSTASSGRVPALVVYSGTEGGAAMTSNLRSLASVVPGLGSIICVVLDGVRYRGDGSAGAAALDDVRSRYDVDNDRTYLMGESAGTTAALALGFSLRQSYFAAYWANDVNACATPERNASALGFAPWGQAGPGGDLTDARCIVDGMRAAGYRLDPDSPYSGPGSTSHGDTNQFIAAVSWFAGKSRR